MPWSAALQLSCLLNSRQQPKQQLLSEHSDLVSTFKQQAKLSTAFQLTCITGGSLTRPQENLSLLLDQKCLQVRQSS